MTTVARVGSVKARSLEPYLGLQLGGRGPRTWPIICCLPGCNLNKLIQEMGARVWLSRYSSLFFPLGFIHFKGRVTGLSFAGLLLKCLRQWAQEQAIKLGARNSILILWWQGLKPLSHLLPPRIHISRKLNWKQTGSQHSLYGVGIPSSNLNHYTTMPSPSSVLPTVPKMCLDVFL